MSEAFGDGSDFRVAVGLEGKGMVRLTLSMSKIMFQESLLRRSR